MAAHDAPRGRPPISWIGATEDRLWLGGLASALLVLYLSTYVVHGYRFPVGPDAPVYIWWARLGGHDGLSAIPGLRPGVPALTLVVGGTFGVGPVAVVAALEIALAMVTAMAAAALAADRGRATWVTVGAFTGLWAVHLALGYLATLAAAALVVAAFAVLIQRRGWAIAGLSLGRRACLTHSSSGLGSRSCWPRSSSPARRSRATSACGSQRR